MGAKEIWNRQVGHPTPETPRSLPQIKLQKNIRRVQGGGVRPHAKAELQRDEKCEIQRENDEE